MNMLNRYGSVISRKKKMKREKEEDDVKCATNKCKIAVPDR